MSGNTKWQMYGTVVEASDTVLKIGTVEHKLQPGQMKPHEVLRLVEFVASEMRAAMVKRVSESMAHEFKQHIAKVIGD